MIKKRLIGFFIDFGLLASASVLINLLVNGDVSIFIMLLLFSAFFCRDSIIGQSIGRRIMHIFVLHGGARIQPARAFVRNLILVIWPLELILLLCNGRRIGDMVTHSTVAECDISSLAINTKGIILMAVIWLLSAVAIFSGIHILIY